MNGLIPAADWFLVPCRRKGVFSISFGGADFTPQQQLDRRPTVWARLALGFLFPVNLRLRTAR